MNMWEMDVERREVASKSRLHRLKENGYIPGNLYSSGESIPIFMEEHRFREVLNKIGDGAIINLNFEGRNIVAKIQEMQRDPLTLEIRHVDLMPVQNSDLN